MTDKIIKFNTKLEIKIWQRVYSTVLGGLLSRSPMETNLSENTLLRISEEIADKAIIAFNKRLKNIND